MTALDPNRPYPDGFWETWTKAQRDAWFAAKPKCAGKSNDPPSSRRNGHNARAAKIILVNAETLEMEPIEWLWHDWLAKGKFHLLAGAPGTGKTTLALSFVATISAGAYWPDATRARAGNVLIWTSEDGLADTIKPRLIRMGADLSRINFVCRQREADGKERPFNPATDMPSLAEAALGISGGVDLLVLDPVVAAIGAKANSHNNAETRNSLQPLIDFSEATACAVAGITHLTKGTAGRDPTERVTGSLAFGALARIIMLAAASDSDTSGPPRILTRAKSNIGISGGGFGYELEAAPLYERPEIIATRIVWLDPIEGTARELLSDAESEEPGGKLSKKDQAARFLKAALANGERPQRDIEAEAKREGIAEHTLRRAAKDVTKRKEGLTGGWFWRVRDAQP